MSNEEDEKLDSKSSLCWKCKHGLSINQSDMQSFFSPSMTPGNDFEGETDQPGVSEVRFHTQKATSVCFWRPNLAPLIFNHVTECNRYEED